MPWHIPVGLRLLTYFIGPVLQKKVADAPSRTRSMRLMFFTCLLLAMGYAILEPPPISFVCDRRAVFLFGLGIANAFAAYAHWRAVAVSLSSTSLFTMMDDVIAMVLGTTVLDEGKLVTPILGIGILVCFGSGFLYLSMAPPRKIHAGSAATTTPAMARTYSFRQIAVWLGWIGIYSVVWGVAAFIVRYAAVERLSGSMFALPWYAGSFLGSLLVFRLMGRAEAGAPFTWLQMQKPVLLGIIAFGSMLLLFWAGHSAPIAVTQPLWQVAEMLIPTLMGLYVFKEISALRRVHKWTFATAFVGTLIIAFSY